LVGLGISWVWLGLEGEASAYRKLRGVETRQLVPMLQSHGIRVLGSTIIGLEDHSPSTIDAVIDYAVGHRTDFHQFMLYTPIPGTALYARHEQEGSLLSEETVPPADAHGQFRFNFRHRHIRDGEETDAAWARRTGLGSFQYCSAMKLPRLLPIWASEDAIPRRISAGIGNPRCTIHSSSLGERNRYAAGSSWLMKSRMMACSVSG
ncbi:MAG: hypothetical protein EDS66_17835, partial [Planctomycetota bacterium]